MSALQVTGAVLLLLGALLNLVAAVGLLRFPDVLTRMHAAAKPATLGVLLVMGGAAALLERPRDRAAVLLVAAFQLVTAPVAAHLLGRAAYAAGAGRRDLLVVDELATGAPATGSAAGAAPATRTAEPDPATGPAGGPAAAG